MPCAGIGMGKALRTVRFSSLTGFSLLHRPWPRGRVSWFAGEPQLPPAVRIKVSGLLLLPAGFVLESLGISSGNLLVFPLSLPPLLLDTQSD